MLRHTAPYAYTCANACVFVRFYDLSKPIFFGGGPGIRWTLLTANTRIHWQTWGFLTYFICKFALHDVNLLRQNGQWGGKEGGG